MNVLSIIAIVLILFSFWLPYRMKEKNLAIIASGILAMLLLVSIAFSEQLFSLFILVLLLLFCPLFIAYWALKNLGVRNSGRILAWIIGIISAFILLPFALEDYWFFKSDAKRFLKEDGVILNDEFTIKSNHITGMKDMYQRFEMEISTSDRNRLINKFQQSSAFIGLQKKMRNLQYDMDRKESKKIYRDYCFLDYVIRETYEKPNVGYKPNEDIITISKTNNVLVFERVNN